ncbi:amino acid ABC transporter permease [Pyramidobacter piscolens]|uniref:amino acid ABC transporter permease n=1 Tax=Pyramidobacter piscolens TaxID=638849 RepID=UPI0026E0E4DB|nr:amino acid ABC transporter permease [Pyramidobacter piscolens]
MRKSLFGRKKAPPLLALAAVLALAGLAWAAPAPARRCALHFERIWPYYKVFYRGMINSREVTFMSVIMGSVCGTVLALLKVSRLGPLSWFATAYTSVFRGTPLMVQLFLVYFATPQLFDYQIPAFNAVVLTFGLNSAAYVSEILRGGIQSIDVGQREAAMALGVPYRAMMFDIVIPQALRTVLPSLVNELIALLKDTSIVATIGMLDMMRAAQTAMNSTYLAFEPFIVVAGMYYVLVMIFTAVASRLERRLHKSDRN